MRPTEKIYYNDAYQYEFSAEAVACDKVGDSWHIILNRSCFYPEGGGQPGDTGFLNDIRIIDSRTVAQEIVHVTESPIDVGETVHGKVDFLRRFAFMQNHTGEHIVSGIINKLHGFENIGFHLGANIMTMDFSGELSKDELTRIEDLANDAVYENVRLESNFIDSADLKDLTLEYRSKKAIEGTVRIVSIPGYDACACAGLHVATSGEVGAIKIISAQRYKGGCRLYALCGRDALEDYRQKNESAHQISALLSVKPNEINQAVEKLLVNIEEQKRLIAGLRNEVFALKAQSYTLGAKLAYVFETDLGPDDMRRFAYEIASRVAVAFVFSNSEEAPDVYRYIICSQSTPEDIAKIAKEMNSALNGRGGAKNEIAQGVVNASRSDIEEYLAKL